MGEHPKRVGLGSRAPKHEKELARGQKGRGPPGRRGRMCGDLEVRESLARLGSASRGCEKRF